MGTDRLSTPSGTERNKVSRHISIRPVRHFVLLLRFLTARPQSYKWLHLVILIHSYRDTSKCLKRLA